MPQRSKKNLSILAIFITVLISFRTLAILSENKIDVLRVAVSMFDVNLPIDPIRNSSLSNAFYVNHMYANLISVNDSNEYVPDLAKSFYWKDQILNIEFDENSKISALDAAFNIKRSFISSQNDHGDLWKVLCASGESAEQCLSRIIVEDSILKILVSNKKNIQMVVPILASINYKIVPITAFDSNNFRTAKIIDPSNTSGKFYIKNNDLSAMYPNEDQFKQDDTLVLKVEIVDANSNNIEELVENNKIDVISTTINLFEKNMNQLATKKWKVDKTHNIKVTILVFSTSAINKTSVGERRLIAEAIKAEAQNSKALFAAETQQYFQNFSQGYLTDQQLLDLKKSSSAKLLSAKIQFAAPSVDRWSKALKHLDNLNVIQIKNNPTATTESLRPDLFVIANDVSFETSYSQISYLLKYGIFKSNEKTAEQVIAEYLNQNDSQERLHYINALHFDVLSKVYIYPIWTAPYVTAVNSELTSNMSKYNSRTLLWKIKKSKLAHFLR